MLTTARVDIPAPVVSRLKHAAEYSDNVNDYAREDLIGFKRPIAAAFAMLAPVTLAFAYQAGGPWLTVQIAGAVIAMVAGGLYVIGREEWPNIVTEFQGSVMAKRKAIADLRCGFGESSFLSNGRAPAFYEHANGVLVVADAGDLKTLFFDIAKDGSDPRWALYDSGEMRCRVWRWLRLPEHHATRTTSSIFDPMVEGLFWIDEDLRRETLAARQSGTAFEPIYIEDDSWRVE